MRFAELNVAKCEIVLALLAEMQDGVGMTDTKFKKQIDLTRLLALKLSVLQDEMKEIDEEQRPTQIGLDGFTTDALDDASTKLDEIIFDLLKDLGFYCMEDLLETTN